MTGQIYGAEKGSAEYYHEQGHLAFNSDPNNSWAVMLQRYSFDFWMLSIMFAIRWNFLFPIAVLTWAVYIGFTIYEEWWCNEYSKNLVNLKKENNIE